MMTTGELLTSCLAVGVVSALGAQAVTPTDLNWKDLLGSGTVGAMLFVIVLFLRSISEMRKEHSDTVTKISADFCDSVEASNKTFADSTRQIIETSRSSNQADIQLIQKIIENLKTKTQ